MTAAIWEFGEIPAKEYFLIWHIAIRLLSRLQDDRSAL